ncbi:MAG: hypothetical protein V2I63_11370 [Pseudomonadales bacterium]|jgi:hypothetical protein|nr:hypothetical protein [Pseudomonadales bacterium]
MIAPAWKDLLAAAGVIVSLVFVGVEIRQNTSAAKGQTRTELAALNQAWLFLLSDPEFGDPFRRRWVSNDVAGMEAEDVDRAELLMVANMRRLENVYFQYDEGLVDESALDSYGFQVSAPLFTGAAFGTWWFDADNRALFHPGFVALFERKIGIGVQDVRHASQPSGMRAPQDS